MRSAGPGPDTLHTDLAKKLDMMAKWILTLIISIFDSYRVHHTHYERRLCDSSAFCLLMVAGKTGTAKWLFPAGQLKYLRSHG